MFMNDTSETTRSTQCDSSSLKCPCNFYNKRFYKLISNIDGDHQDGIDLTKFVFPKAKQETKDEISSSTTKEDHSDYTSEDMEVENDDTDNDHHSSSNFLEEEEDEKELESLLLFGRQSNAKRHKATNNNNNSEMEGSTTITSTSSTSSSHTPFSSISSSTSTTPSSTTSSTTIESSFSSNFTTSSTTLIPFSYLFHKIILIALVLIICDWIFHHLKLTLSITLFFTITRKFSEHISRKILFPSLFDSNAQLAQSIMEKDRTLAHISSLDVQTVCMASLGKIEKIKEHFVHAEGACCSSHYNCGDEIVQCKKRIQSIRLMDHIEESNRVLLAMLQNMILLQNKTTYSNLSRIVCSDDQCRDLKTAINTF